MSTTSEWSDRYRTVAGTFTARVDEVPADRWDAPAPPDGWVARDVVRHLCEWLPGFFSSFAGVELPTTAALVDTDPPAAWHPLHAALQAALDDPDVSARTFDMQGRTLRVDEAIDQFGTGDILVHTWDLARATGLDERLDPDEVHRAYTGMLPYDEMLRSSGHYGPAVPVPDDADEQTKLIAFTGRRP